MPRVTVLMPVRNGENYLAAAMDSILTQSFRDFEFLIIDDGSTDRTPEILELYTRRDRRVRMERGRTAGVIAALNQGLVLAQGEIVVRMDADDIAMPERIARQIAYLDEHPHVVAVGSAVQIIAPDGKPIRQVRYPTTPHDVRHYFTIGGLGLRHPAVAMRRASVMAIGGYHSAFVHAEDYDLWLRLLDRHELANLPDILLSYRSHDGQVSARYGQPQALAYFLARLAAEARRRGEPDPTANLDHLSIADLDRFTMPDHIRASFLFRLSDVALHDYEKTGDPRRLADLMESLRRHGYAPHPVRARRLARALLRHLWRTGNYSMAISLCIWMARSEFAQLQRAKS